MATTPAPVKPTPASATVRKHDADGLLHEFPKATWELLSKADQKNFTDAADKPAVIEK